MIPDYRQDTSGRDAFNRIAPRVLVSLLGLAVAATAAMFKLPTGAIYSACITGFVLVYVGVQGFWLPFTREVQLAAAAWLAASTFVFRLDGPPMWLTLALSAALLLVTSALRS